MGGRSERNDHLLLHAFTERDYIVPERSIASNHRAALKHTQEVKQVYTIDFMFLRKYFPIVLDSK